MSHQKQYGSGKGVNFKYAVGEVDILGKTFHEDYELYLLLSGEVEFINDHARQRIVPYQLVIIPPGVYHQFRILNHIEKYERCVLNLSSDFLEEKILRSAFKGKEILTFNVSHRIIADYTYLAEGLRRLDAEDYSFVLSAVATDIVFLIKNASQGHMLRPGNLRETSLEVMDYINGHYTEPLDLKCLAERFHLSVSSLCHIFREDFGISVKKYIVQKRMSEACMALKGGEKPERVSVAYGFANYATFYRAFKLYFGISPSKAACEVTIVNELT